MSNPSNPPPDPEEVFRRLDEAKKARPWRYYAPIPVLRDGFHQSTSPIRLLTGPNGGGKTWAGAYELVSFLTGYNHIRNEHYPYPNRCWAVALDHVNLGPIQRRTMMEMCPKGTKFHAKDMKLTLPAPWHSECYFKVCEAGADKFMGERCLAIWFDEEWDGPEGLKIFKESMRRTKPGWPLKIYMTVTPVNGYSWSYDYLWKEDSPSRFQGVETFNFSLYDCLEERGGFFTREDLERERSKCEDIFEEQIRIHGQYTLLGASPAFDGKLLLDAMDRAIPGKRYNIKAGRFDSGLVAPILEENQNGELHILVPPEKGQQYILGGDPSMGVRRDRAAASVWHRTLPIECAYFASNKMEPSRFAREVVAPLGSYYNNALAAIESNSEAGGATIANLMMSYGNIYMRQDFITSQKTFKRSYGFRTDLHSRGLIFSTLKDYLTLPNFMGSQDLIREMMGMVVKEDNKIDHQDGKHDDHVMAAGIALAVNRTNPAPRYDAWANYRESYAGEDAWLGN